MLARNVNEKYPEAKFFIDQSSIVSFTSAVELPTLLVHMYNIINTIKFVYKNITHIFLVDTVCTTKKKYIYIINSSQCNETILVEVL